MGAIGPFLACCCGQHCVVLCFHALWAKKSWAARGGRGVFNTPESRISRECSQISRQRERFGDGRHVWRPPDTFLDDGTRPAKESSAEVERSHWEISKCIIYL